MATNAVNVQGAIYDKTIVFAGTNVDAQALDGLDATIELTHEALLHYVLNAYSSVGSGYVTIIPEIDGALRWADSIETSAWGTSGSERSGMMMLHVGPGTHRIRLMMVCANACTVTQTHRNRSMTVIVLE